jgi:hypothetical protein
LSFGDADGEKQPGRRSVLPAISTPFPPAAAPKAAKELFMFGYGMPGGAGYLLINSKVFLCFEFMLFWYYIEPVPKLIDYAVKRMVLGHA